MIELPLNALRAFAIVHREGGIRAASRVLGVTHSSISRHVRELESWIGVGLLEANRANRALAFTVHGETLGRACLSGFETLAEVVVSLREARSPNTVTVSTAPSFAAPMVVAKSLRFQHAAPVGGIVGDCTAKDRHSRRAGRRCGHPDGQGAMAGCTLSASYGRRSLPRRRPIRVRQRAGLEWFRIDACHPAS